MGTTTRGRWAAIGAAVAVALGSGTIEVGHATEPSGAVTYVPITPCRLLDTRPGDDNVGNRSTPIGNGETHRLSAHGDNGNCTDIPATATGLSLNVTALNSIAATYLTIWPTGAEQPFTANLNPTPGQPPTPNAVTTGLSGAGQFDVFNFSGSVDVVIDVFGYYTDHRHTGADIVDGSLTGADIAANSVDSGDLSNEPGISTNWASSLGGLPSTPTAVLSTTIRVPSDGYLYVHTSGQWNNADVTEPDTDAAICQLQKGTNPVVIDFAQPYFTLNDRSAAQGNADFSGHRVIPVSASDNPPTLGTGQVVRLACDEVSGAVGLTNVVITALFVPTNYQPGVF